MVNTQLHPYKQCMFLIIENFPAHNKTLCHYTPPRYNLIMTPTAIAPIFRLTAALGISVLTWLWLSMIPPIAVGVTCGLLAIGLLLRRFYVLAGGCLGVVSVCLFIAPPITQSYADCTYHVVIDQADYSQQRLGKTITLRASQIVCHVENPTPADDTLSNTTSSPIDLPNQKLLFYDSQRQFHAYQQQNVKLILQSQLIPVHGRLNHHAFDYEKYLHENGIRLQIKSPTVLSQIPLYHPIIRLRNTLTKTIQSNLSPKPAAIILALIVGNRSALTPSQKAIMQHTGSSHILAISGLHLALIGGWTWLLVQWLWGISLRLNRYLQPIQAGAIAALCVITLYALVSGFDIPVRRAWLMFSLLILAWLTLRPLNYHSLLLAGCVVVFFDPYALLSVGFYFSFIATAVVLWAARLPYSPIIKILILQGVITTTLLPITWFVFGTVSLGGFFVNLLIIPWLGLWVLPVAIIACGLTVFTAPTWLWQFLSLTTEALWHVITWFERLDWHFTPNTQPHLFSVVIAVTCLLLCLYRRTWWYSIGILSLWIPLPTASTPAVVMADERSTSVLVHNGKTAILLNPGRKYRHINHADKWVRYLNQRGLSLSHVVLSDDKLSHISATYSLLKRFPNAEVITLKDVPLPYDSHYCQPITLANLNLKTTLSNKNCHAKIIWFDHVIDIGGNTANAILPHATLRWHHHIYDAQRLGAITITPTQVPRYLRQQHKPWREVIAP